MGRIRGYVDNEKWGRECLFELSISSVVASDVKQVGLSALSQNILERLPFLEPIKWTYHSSNWKGWWWVDVRKNSKKNLKSSSGTGRRLGNRHLHWVVIKYLHNHELSEKHFLVWTTDLIKHQDEKNTYEHEHAPHGSTWNRWTLALHRRFAPLNSRPRRGNCICRTVCKGLLSWMSNLTQRAIA